DGSGYGIYARRYNSAGAIASAELPVNTTTTGSQMQPAAAGLANGTFVVVWQSADKSGSGIYGQGFAAGGAKLGGEFRVNTTTAKDQLLPSIAALSDGGFLVAWTSDAQDGSGLGIYAQRF